MPPKIWEMTWLLKAELPMSRLIVFRRWPGWFQMNVIAYDDGGIGNVKD